VSGDIHSAHRRALVETLFAEQKDDPEFRMSARTRVVWWCVAAWCRCRDAWRVLCGRAEIKVTYDR
jgi:hypothetical protein